MQEPTLKQEAPSDTPITIIVIEQAQPTPPTTWQPEAQTRCNSCSASIPVWEIVATSIAIVIFLFYLSSKIQKD